MVVHVMNIGSGQRTLCRVLRRSYISDPFGIPVEHMGYTTPGTHDDWSHPDAPFWLLPYDLDMLHGIVDHTCLASCASFHSSVVYRCGCMYVYGGCI